MELQNTNWQNFFFDFILAGLILFVIFKIIRFLLPILVKSFKKASPVISYFPIFETAGWLFFFSWYTFRFAEIKSIYALVIASVLLVIIFWISRFFLKDLIAGLIYRSSDRFKPGDQLNLDEWKGTIKKFRLTVLEIESSEGNTLFIPYNKLIDAVNIRSDRTDQTASYTFLLETKLTKSLDETLGDIKYYILSLPWSSVQKSPQLVLREQSDERLLVEVTVYPVDKTYTKKIENEITKKYQPTKP